MRRFHAGLCPTHARCRNRVEQIGKQPVIDAIVREQAPWRERAEAYLSNPKQVHWIVEVGTERARTVARETMRGVRDAMGLNY